MNNRLTEAHSAARKRLIAYARQTGRVTCAMVAEAWRLGMPNDDALYAAAGAGWAEKHLREGNDNGFANDATAQGLFPRTFINSYNAAMAYGKLNAALEG